MFERYVAGEMLRQLITISACAGRRAKRVAHDEPVHPRKDPTRLLNSTYVVQPLAAYERECQAQSSCVRKSDEVINTR
jgi:hypothetical protein